MYKSPPERAGICLFYLNSGMLPVSWLTFFFTPHMATPRYCSASSGTCPHFLQKFVIGFAALGQVGEIYCGQFLKFRPVQFFPNSSDHLRRAPEYGDGKFDNPQVRLAAPVQDVGSYHLRQHFSQGDTQNRRRVGDKAQRQVFVQDNDTFFVVPIHNCFLISNLKKCSDKRRGTDQ